MSNHNEKTLGAKSKTQGFETADILLWEILKENSKANRRHPTPAEDTFLQLVRNSKTGHKIRRQHAIDGYIADFACLSKGLVIELEGGYHLLTKDQDQLRTSVLNELGFQVIRFTNDEVIRYPQNIFLKVKAALDKQPDRKI